MYCIIQQTKCKAMIDIPCQPMVIQDEHTQFHWFGFTKLSAEMRIDYSVYLMKFNLKGERNKEIRETPELSTVYLFCKETPKRMHGTLMV